MLSQHTENREQSKLIKLTDTFSVHSIANEVRTILLHYPLRDNQLCLTTTTPKEQDPYEGVGSLYDFEAGKWRRQEGDFKYFLKEFIDTEIHSLYKAVLSREGGTAGRIRIMALAPRTCYSFHRDTSIRYHFAVKSNSQSFIMFYPDTILSIPPDGHLYQLDTRSVHSAMNGGREERIHIVISSSNETFFVPVWKTSR